MLHLSLSVSRVNYKRMEFLWSPFVAVQIRLNEIENTLQTEPVVFQQVNSRRRSETHFRFETERLYNLRANIDATR